MNSLVRNFMNDDTCFSANVKQNISVNQSVISSYRNVVNNPHEYDEIIELLEGKKARAHISELEEAARKQKKSSILNISGKSGQHDGGNMGTTAQINYLSYFAGRVKPTDKMTGDRATDEAAGIMHYVLGKDKGIVKNITLSKNQTSGLLEVRFEQEGYDGLPKLRLVYDVEIDSYAAVKTFPGTYLFVNPQSFAPTTNLVPCHPLNLTQYGIGGYYMIIRSEHSFAAGVADTRISAKWVNEVDEIEGQFTAEQEGLCKGVDGTYNVKKCGQLSDSDRIIGHTTWVNDAGHEMHMTMTLGTVTYGEYTSSETESEEECVAREIGDVCPKQPDSSSSEEPE